MGSSALIQIVQPFFVANGDALQTLDGIERDLEIVSDLGKGLFVRVLQAVEDFERLRGAGVSPDEVRSANARAGTRLSIDNLVALAQRGWR